MATQLDESLLGLYEEIRESPLKLCSFLKRRKFALSVFSSMKDIDEAIGCKGKFATIPRTVARLMMDSKTMKSMFTSTWLECSRVIYVETVKGGLVALENEEFATDHDERFQNLLEVLSDRLRADGHRRGRNKWSTKIEIYGEHVPVTMEFAGDEGEFLYWGRVCTIVANTKQYPVYPWVELLFDAGTLEPLEVLKDNIMEVIGTTRSLEKMISLMATRYEEFKEFHSSFELEMSFLENRAMVVLKQKVRE